MHHVLLLIETINQLCALDECFSFTSKTSVWNRSILQGHKVGLLCQLVRNVSSWERVIDYDELLRGAYKIVCEKKSEGKIIYIYICVDAHLCRSMLF
jgi:hypothetical protein